MPRAVASQDGRGPRRLTSVQVWIVFYRAYHNPLWEDRRWANQIANEMRTKNTVFFFSFPLFDVGSFFFVVVSLCFFKWMLNVPFCFPDYFFWEMRQHSINIWGICARRVIRIIHIWAIPFFCLRFLSWTATMMTHDDLFMFQLRCGVGIQHCECSGCIDYRKVMRQKRVHQSAVAKMVLFWWKRWVLREQETFVFEVKIWNHPKKNKSFGIQVFFFVMFVGFG